MRRNCLGRQRRPWLVFLVSCLMALAAAADGEKPTYLLGTPPAQLLCNATNASQVMDWAWTNAMVSPLSLAHVQTNQAEFVVDNSLEALRWYAKSAVGGFPFERAKPQYYLGDKLVPPEGVNWEATYAAYLTMTNRENFLFDTFGRRVYVVRGETTTFKWVVEDEGRLSTNEIPVVAVPISAGRPKNVFWTDTGAGGSPIDLSGKFVQLLGPTNLLAIVEGEESTGVLINGSNTTRKVILRGVYVDEQSGTKMLYAAGKLEGQFVIAYYDSGADSRKLVDVITVRVSERPVQTRTAEVGGQLLPDGQGYSVEGLEPMPDDLADQDDGRGPYVYQHQGTYSYSPKNKAVFALRPTTEQTKNHTLTTWYETDNQGVKWPYEAIEYIVSWPTNMPVVVRGDSRAPGLGVKIPEGYTAQLQKFQDDGVNILNQSSHAREPADGYFTPIGAGRSLLKLTGDDNVWFVPFRSVLRTDPEWCDLTEMGDVPVGRELAFRRRIGGSPFNRDNLVSADISGYVYAPVSARVWNPDIYSDTGTLADGVQSSIYAVTASLTASETNQVEVWWSESYAQDDMPNPLAVPTCPQRWNVRWPLPAEAPTIVLASQLGSAGESFWTRGRALTFAATNATVEIPKRAYFSEKGGTILFWTRQQERLEAAGNADAASAICPLLSLATDDGASLTVDYDEAKGFVISTPDGMNATGVVADPHTWHLFKLAWSGSSVTCCVFTAENTLRTLCAVDTVELKVDAAKFAACVAEGCLGYREAEPVAKFGRCLDQVVFVDEPLDDDIETLRPFLTDDPAADRRVTMAYTFDGSDELADIGMLGEFIDHRVVIDRKLDVEQWAVGCEAEAPGAPCFATAVLASEQAPVLYRQTDRTKGGYNPNEEHAFVEAGSGGYVAWAMRCDLNKGAKAGDLPQSKPGVLVSYVQDNKARMQYFNVVVTNAFYPFFGATCTVGAQLPGPHPFDLFEKPWLERTNWDPDAMPPFRDRKKQVWARAPGAFDIRMFYQQQATFDWPDGLKTPSVGEPVAWLAYDGATDLSAPTDTPKPWHWTVEWPTTGVPTMKIGYTLTTSEFGLPEVWSAKSMAVLYPTSDVEKVVLLSDPTVARREKLGFKATTDNLSAAGLRTGPGEKLQNKKGFYYFNGITATLSDRLYIDPTTDELVLIGKKETKSAGVNLLFPNVLMSNEVASVRALLGQSGLAKLETAVSALEKLESVRPSKVEKTGKDGEYADTYAAPDHYALTAVGTGAMGATNWVVLIENNATNSFCDAGNPISMRLLKIVPEYFVGSVATREDANNLLSQILSVHYSQNFAGQAKDFEFQWARRAPSAAEGQLARQGFGLASFSVGEQGDTLANMVNTYWCCRYRAKEGTETARTMGTDWSDWSNEGLAEGWVQRCLNNITPFTQRMTDLYNNAAETSVTMMRQAGKPYQGDVALNQDNLKNVGLVELYRTILNKAETLSVRQKIDNAEANKQLLLAVERLADLYNVLGDEAYADAVNPTIGFGSNFTEIETGLTIDYGAASSSLFCFDNQVSSLLDEELALVRGRDCLANPDGQTAPYYNRLIWNFTKGITAGEVAYAVNYGISGHRSSTITAATAAEQYPQGHGDAYGHYLSALQGYYRLLRNPYFSWGTPGMGEMNVADSVVNVDYYDEATFAQSAANVAKAAQKAVELTALKAWRDNTAETVGAGYLDANVTNAFGYGEWASRGAYGAFCNWAVANSLLPEAKETDDDGVPYADKGLTRIDRSTAPGIAALSATVASIERTCDRMDAGLNPLGLDANAVPFDLTPIGDASDATHYEQVRARAGQAFENARKVLDRAQEYANRLKLIQEAEAGAIDNLDYMEDDFAAQLIAIYGRPYEKDTGPSGTYAQGYYGPDTYHYMWMDLSKYGLTSVADVQTVTTVTYQVSTAVKDGKLSSFDTTGGICSPQTNTVSYSLSANGVVIKPSAITGERPASGELQLAYADFLSAYSAVSQKMTVFNNAKSVREQEISLLKAQASALASLKSSLDFENEKLKSYYHTLFALKETLVSLDILKEQLQPQVANKTMVGCIGLATTLGWDAWKAAERWAWFLSYTLTLIGIKGVEEAIPPVEYYIQIAELSKTKASENYANTSDTVSLWERAMDAVSAETAAAADLVEAAAALTAAQEPISKLLQDARAIEETRELVRQQYVNNISKLRYNDMFFRKLRNAALSQYDAAFALAQKYTLLAAKAYAYETGSPLESTEEGRALLRSIVGARALGEVDNDGRPMVGENGDAGLSGILAKLDANWTNQKTQLGINNPQPYATWFSLRHGLFRILSGTLGDDAWAKELAKYWVEDIRTDPDFVRSCQPFSSQFGLADKEPGLIIPFETTIDFAYNLFGKPLAFDDAQFDSTWYATKISKAGVWFEGYNEKAEKSGDGGEGPTAFATTPNVYLVPVGTDLMRVPGADRNDEIVGFNVVDQTIPVPYPLTAAEIAEANWFPTYSGETAGVDAESRIRRHPSFRAYFGNRGVKPTDAALDAVRLVGRSVWNTRWILVIPAGALNADRDQALKSFIYGLDTDRDGVIDIKPVSDIKIGFRTYSHGGK